MPVEPPSPSGGGSPSDGRSPSARNWNAISGISAVVGVVLAIVTGLIGFFAFISPRSAAPTPPRLSLVDVSVKPGTEIQYSPAVGEDPRGFSGFAITDNRIDVQLQNEGGAPELIKSVEASVVYAKQLEFCIGTGGPGSVLQAATEYGISVPTSPAPKESDLPLVLSQSTPVVVEPNSFGRIAVVIGPDIVSSGFGPWVYVFDLSVVTRSGRVGVGRFTFVTPTSQIKALHEDLESHDRRTQAECSRDGLTKILKAANLEGTAAPEVLALRQRYTELAMLRPGEDLAGQIARSDSWERTTGAVQCGGTREAYGSVIHFGDLNGDQVEDAIVALTCNKEPGFSPDSIEVFDGRLVHGEPRSIGVLLTGAQLRGVHGLGRGVSIDSAGVIRIELSYGDPFNLSRQFAAVFAFRYVDQRFVALGNVRCRSRGDVPVEVPCPGLGGR